MIGMNMNNDFENYLLELVSINEVELYNIIKYQLGWEDESGNKIENPNPKNRKFSNLVLSISNIFGADKKNSYPLYSYKSQKLIGIYLEIY